MILPPLRLEERKTLNEHSGALQGSFAFHPSAIDIEMEAGEGIKLIGTEKLFPFRRSQFASSLLNAFRFFYCFQFAKIKLFSALENGFSVPINRKLALSAVKVDVGRFVRIMKGNQPRRV